MLFMIIDTDDSLTDTPSHPVILIYALPNLRISLNLYFLFICSTVLTEKIKKYIKHKKDWGIGEIFSFIVRKFIFKP